MKFSRREALVLALGSAAAAAIPLPALAAVEQAIADFTGGAAVAEGGITLTTPEIAENGNTVPISVEAPGAVAIMVVAAGNPTPGVCRATFGDLAGAQMFGARIRLAGTQDVVAIAQMADGSFVRASNEVKVTIGGCGG